jgi:hypothetical protein
MRTFAAERLARQRRLPDENGQGAAATLARDLAGETVEVMAL